MTGSASRDYNYFTILLFLTLNKAWTRLIIFGIHNLIAYTYLAEVKDAISTDRSPCEADQSYKS